MQLAAGTMKPVSAANFALPEATPAELSRYSQYKVIRRNGSVVVFEPSKIAIAMTKAFIAVNGGQGAASARVRDLVANLTEAVVSALMRRQPSPRSRPSSRRPSVVEQHRRSQDPHRPHP